MSLLHTQKPLRSLLAHKETASVIVAVPSGTQPHSVITATYDTGVDTPVISNKAGSLGALSPIDGASQQPIVSDTVGIPVSSLLKVGECADCSSDLYADNATADAMQEHAFSGACVMCGSRISYKSTGELAQIATSVDSEEQRDGEIANYFDFTELNTVDPNKIEEHDMSALKARQILRASVAEVLASAASKIETAEDDIMVLPSDDDEIDDFAEETDEELEVMDMDESDPADEDIDTDDIDDEDDGEEVLDEEASASQAEGDSAVTVTATNDAPAGETVEQPETASPEAINVEQPAAEVQPEASAANTAETAEVEQTPASEVAEEVTETVDEAPAAEVTDTEEVIEQPSEEVATDEAPVSEATNEETEIANDTPIEYQATTLEQLSPNADFVPVSETAYYIVQDSCPVVVLNKEQASEGAKAIWNKPIELRNAYRAGLNSNRSAVLASFGGKILTVKTTVGDVVAERVSKLETAAATSMEEARAGFSTRFRQCLEIASLGTVKGMFGPNVKNHVADELASVLSANGVREPIAIVVASMIESMPKFIDTVMAKAFELADESDAALTAKAEMVGNAQAAPVINVEAPAAPAPETETAASIPAPKAKETASVTSSRDYDVQRLLRSVGTRR